MPVARIILSASRHNTIVTAMVARVYFFLDAWTTKHGNAGLCSAAMPRNADFFDGPLKSREGRTVTGEAIPQAFHLDRSFPSSSVSTRLYRLEIEETEG